MSTVEFEGVDGPVIFGEVLFDSFEDGSRVLGGAPFNVAWHLQAFGVEPVLVSRVGTDDNGERIRQSMQQWGMRLDGLQTDPVHQTGEVSVALSNGQPSYEILPDQAYDHISLDWAWSKPPALLYHGTLAARSAVSAVSLKGLRENLDRPIFVDVNLRPPWWQAERVATYLHGAKWVKLNEDELLRLAPETVTSALQSRAQSFLQHYDLSLVIVTLGERGAIALQPDGRCIRTAPQKDTPVVDTVGAGDAFASVCILGLLRNWPVQTLLERAQQFASVVVAHRGATTSDRALYAPLLERWQIG